MLRQPYIYISYKKETKTFPNIRVDNLTHRKTNPLLFITEQILNKHHRGLVMIVNKFDYTDNLIYGTFVNSPFDSVYMSKELLLMSETSTYIPNGRYFN